MEDYHKGDTYLKMITRNSQKKKQKMKNNQLGGKL